MTIGAGNLDSSAFNIQGVGFASGLEEPKIGCMDVLANNYNIDTDGVYVDAGEPYIFNTQSVPGGPNECTYTGCMDANASTFFSTVYNGETYYATTPGSCEYEGCNDPLALNYNTTCGGYALPVGLLITITNNGCCTYPQSWECDTEDGGCTTATGGTGDYVVCHDYYDSSAPANTPANCYASPQLAQAAACPSLGGACSECGSNSIVGCTDECAPNYNPLANCDDGSCETIVYGCMDNGEMTISQVNSFGNSIWPTTTCLGYACAPYNSYDSSWSYIDLNGTQLNDVFGNDITADSVDTLATHMDCDKCEYSGCTDPQAINYESFYNKEDGSCIYAGCTNPNSLSGVTTYNHPNPILYDNLGNVITTFYVNPIEASVENGSCSNFGCNMINTPNINPWDGNSISHTMINDVVFEEMLKNQIITGDQKRGITYGHAGEWDDSVPPLDGPGSITGGDCGMSSTFATNINNVVDYGNGTNRSICGVDERLTHMGWDDGFGNFVYDGLVCAQGFANAWGPYDPNVYTGGVGGGGHNDGLYITNHNKPRLTTSGQKTLHPTAGLVLTDLSGIQDYSLNPAFKRLVIHNQEITSFIHTETDPASSYHQLDMLDNLFHHAPNFDCLSLKSCKLGGTGQVLDVSDWQNCGIVELVDLSYDELMISHSSNTKCHSIFIINDKYNTANSNNYAQFRGHINISRAKHHAAQRNIISPSHQLINTNVAGGGYSTDLSIDWASHTAGNIPMPTQIDSDESYRQVIRNGFAYPKGALTNTIGGLWGSMYENPDSDVGEHFPPQPNSFTGWDPSDGTFYDGPAVNFVPQFKIAEFNDDGTDYGKRAGNATIDTRRGSFKGFPEQTLHIAGHGSNQGDSTDTLKPMFNYQGNIEGKPLHTSGYHLGIYYNGYGWLDHPSTSENAEDPHGKPATDYYGPGTSFPSHTPPTNPATGTGYIIDLEITEGKKTNVANLGTIRQSNLILINLKNLRHVWLGPDWDPAYAMNSPRTHPNGTNFGVLQVIPRYSLYRSFSIKGCGDGQTVYVHTAGRAAEFKKRYGTNDTSAENQFNEPIWSQEGQDFFLQYFDSNVVFVD